MRKLTLEEWIKKAREVHGDKYDYSKVEYINSRTKVTIICPIHGEFQMLANNHLRGQGCLKCWQKYKYPDTSELEVIRRKYSKNDDYINIRDKNHFISYSTEIHNGKYSYDKITEYINLRTIVPIICPEHGEFLQLAYNHCILKHGCPKCARLSNGEKCRGTKENFIKRAKKVHGNKYNYDKVNYITLFDPVIIVCPEHGDFILIPKDHTRLDKPTGCQKCRLKSQTKLYEKLKESFPNEEILFEIGRDVVPWLGLQRFDIYFPKYNIAVEYNGKLHYIPVKYFGGEITLSETKERDELKRKKCKENNCTLFEVKYDYTEEDYNNLITNINLILY